MRRALLQISLTLVTVAAFLGVLLWLNPTLLDTLRNRQRIPLPLNQVECPTPPGMSADDFLLDVQYYGRLPDQVDLAEEGVEDKLRSAFAAHPWVKAVEEVRVTPPKEVKVQLVFRRPVLAVKTPTGLKAVDEEGILLPRGAAVSGLPVLERDVRPPKGPEGTRWGDRAVEEAAAQAGRKK